jgi:hypothetical protein
MTLFLLRVKNSARIPRFARYLAGLIIQRGGKGQGGWTTRGRRMRAPREAVGKTINRRSSALSPEIPRPELLATDILNLHRQPTAESFVRISLRESRGRTGRCKGRTGNSLRRHESPDGYLIRSRPGRLLANTFCKRSGYIDLQFPLAVARRANVSRQ